MLAKPDIMAGKVTQKYVIKFGSPILNSEATLLRVEIILLNNANQGAEP